MGLTDDPAKVQQQAAANTLSLQEKQFNTQQENIKPWLTAGTSAVNQLATGTAAGGQFSKAPQFAAPEIKPYGMGDFQNSPQYQLMLQQQGNILASNRAGAAGGGSLGSGNQMVALQALAGQNANQFFQQGFNNDQTGYNNRYKTAQDTYNSQVAGQNTMFNMLSGIAGTGQVASSQLANAGQNLVNTSLQTGQMMGNAAQGRANMLSSAGNQLGAIGGQFAKYYADQNATQNYQYGSTYGDAGGNINNVDFGSFGDTSSMGW